MGGVDLADRMLPYCPSRSRTKKWTVRCILHFVDLALVNSWLQMRKYKKEQGFANRDIPQFRTFKLMFGERLINKNCGPNEASDEEGSEEDNMVFEDGRKKSLPALDVRRKGATHLPKVHEGPQQRCRMAKCNLKSTIYCSKCNVFLCLKKNKNCFFEFHSK